jgi:hypothetical protein
MGEVVSARENSPQAVSRLRRIVEFPLILMVIAVVIYVIGSSSGVMLLKEISQSMGMPLGPVKATGTPLMVAGALVLVAFLLFSYWIFCRFVEWRPMRDFARENALQELLAGLIAGAAIFSAVVAVVAALGGYHILGYGKFDSIWPLLALAITSSVGEELLFRGILFRFIERTGGSWVALVLTSALFGGAHITNPGATLFSSLAIALEAGILLGGIYMLTRRLWAVIGVHAAWNFTQGWIFGLPVSGTSPNGIVRAELTGPEILTGGAFGLEASIVTVVIVTSVGLATLYLAVRRGRVISPMWSKPALSGSIDMPPGA